MTQADRMRGEGRLTGAGRRGLPVGDDRAGFNSGPCFTKRAHFIRAANVAVGDRLILADGTAADVTGVHHFRWAGRVHVDWSAGSALGVLIRKDGDPVCRAGREP